MSDGKAHLNIWKHDELLQIERIEASNQIHFGPGFHGFVELDGSGWTSAFQDIKIVTEGAPIRVVLAINVAADVLPAIQIKPHCSAHWMREHKVWEKLVIDVPSGVGIITLCLRGVAVAEPHGSGRDLGFRFFPEFAMVPTEEVRPEALFGNLRNGLPQVEPISIFDPDQTPAVGLEGLGFQNAIVRDAYLIGFPGIIAVERSGTLAPLVESNPYKHFLKPNIATCVANLPDETRSVQMIESAMSLCGDWAENFWHWWHEFLPYAVAAWHAGWKGFFVVPSGSRLFIDSLAVCGIPNTHVVPMTTDIVKVNRLLMPNRQRGQYTPEGFKPFKTINKIIDTTFESRKPFRHLYIARRSSRVVRNEDVVFGFLEAFGFEKVFMEDHTIAQQIEMAHQALSIVGPHGAGMTAALFMPPGGILIELFGPTYVNPCMLDVCRDLGHRYAMVVSRIYRDQPYEAGDDLDVDLPSLQAAMRSFQ